MLEVARKRFTVAEFERMAETGVLDADSRLELLDGEIFEMSPIHPPHAGCVHRLIRQFGQLGERVVLSVQSPLVLDDQNVPQPDVMLLRPRHDLYATAHPRPADVLLLVEVADTTLRYDHEVKVPLYARAGVPEVWLVDLNSAQLHVFRDPTADGYRSQASLGRGESVAPEAVSGNRLEVAEILG